MKHGIKKEDRKFKRHGKSAEPNQPQNNLQGKSISQQGWQEILQKHTF